MEPFGSKGTATPHFSRVAGIVPSRASTLLRLLLPILLIPLVLLVAEMLVGAWPVAVSVDARPDSVAFSVDGEALAATIPSPVEALRIPSQSPYLREHQIDGSDSTNNFTLDPLYFASIGESPFYRFQALLRGEEGMSRWRGLEVRDGDGRSLVREEAPAPGAMWRLPEQFTARVGLQRPELARRLELILADGRIVWLELNRTDRYARVVMTVSGLEETELARRYFPTDWRPQLASLAFLGGRVLALAMALLLALRAAGRLLPRAPLPIPWRGHALLWALAGAGGSLAAGLYTTLALFGGAPHILDAVSYYFQGRLLAEGSLAAPAPSIPDAFPTPFTIIRDGRWFSQYPPGATAALAIGFLAGVPWLVEPLMAAATVLLVYGAGRRMYGAGLGAAAALLLTTSPFVALMAGSFMSHVPATFFLAVFLYAAARLREGWRTRWAVLTAASLGGAFLTREVAALITSLPVGVFLLASARLSAGGWPARALRAAAAVFGFAVVLYLGYNFALAGSPLPPRLLFFAGDRFGFGEGVGFYGRHTLAAGLVNADQLLTSLSLFMAGWPVYFSLALVALPFLARRARDWDWVHGSLVLLFLGAHVGYFYHGIALGPRYLFEAMPSLVLLSARGLQVAADVAWKGAPSDVDTHRGWRVPLPVALLVAGLLACNLLFFAPRQGELYRGYTGIPGVRMPDLQPLVQPLVPADGEGLLVFTDDWWSYSVILAPLNRPTLDGPVIYALAEGGDRARLLAANYPGRVVYRLRAAGEGFRLDGWDPGER